jgi:hypothetical protein
MDTSVAVPNSGSAAIDAEVVRTEAGPVDRQRVSISGDLATRIVDALEALVAEQRLTNALLKKEFRSDLTLKDLGRT